MTALKVIAGILVLALVAFASVASAAAVYLILCVLPGMARSDKDSIGEDRPKDQAGDVEG